MARPIDADALFAEFENVGWYNNADRDEIAEPLILQAPTIDAVSVVRCKDCKFNGAWCDIQEIQWSGYDKPVEWCSYGEVRDE